MAETWEKLQRVLEAYPMTTYLSLIGIAVLVSPVLRLVVGRAALRFAILTSNVADDLIVDALRPFRFVFFVPIATGLFLAPMAAPYAYEARNFFGLLFILLAVDTIIKVLNGVGAATRQKLDGTRVNIAALLDLSKVAVVIAGITTAIAFTSETTFWSLLGGIGAITAVLMFIFKDTLLCIIASMQIASWDHVREGDWIEVPNFSANGIVQRIGLYDIKVLNWDLSTSLIPTYAVLGTGCKNYRSMNEAKARRIKRALRIDIGTIKFCERKLLQKLQKFSLISDLVAEKTGVVLKANLVQPESLNEDGVVTNLDLFRAYVERYLRSRTDLHQKRMYIIVMDLEPTSHGLPLEIVAFTRNTDRATFEAIQSDIFSHLIAMAGIFELGLYQSLTSPGNDTETATN